MPKSGGAPNRKPQVVADDKAKQSSFFMFSSFHPPQIAQSSQLSRLSLPWLSRTKIFVQNDHFWLAFRADEG
jgi:hypothetical protein